MFILKYGKPVPQKVHGRVGSNTVLYYFSGFQFHDKEDIQPFETEGVNGKEIAGKDRVPMGGKKPFPGKSWLNISGFSEMVHNPADSFMGYLN